MSTPVKPPGGPPGSPGASDQAGPVEGKPGELRELVEAEAAAEGGGAEGVSESPAVGSVEADLRAGRIGADEAVERLVQRALESVPRAQRAAVESQLRAALAHDPTLLALRKDLERASQT